MNRALYLISALIFVVVMTAIYGGFMSLKSYFSGDFPLGFLVGVFLTLGVVALIRKFEQSSSGSNTPAQEKRSRYTIDL